MEDLPTGPPILDYETPQRGPSKVPISVRVLLGFFAFFLGVVALGFLVSGIIYGNVIRLAMGCLLVVLSCVVWMPDLMDEW